MAASISRHEPVSTTAWLTRTATNIWNKHVWWLAPPPPAASYNSHKIIINTFRVRSWRSLNILRGHLTIPKRSHGRPRKPSNWLFWDVLPIRIVKLSTGSPSSLIKLAHGEFRRTFEKKTVSLPSYFSTAEKELLQDTVLRYTMLHKLFNLWHNVVKGGFIIVWFSSHPWDWYIFTSDLPLTTTTKTTTTIHVDPTHTSFDGFIMGLWYRYHFPRLAVSAIQSAGGMWGRGKVGWQHGNSWVKKMRGFLGGAGEAIKIWVLHDSTTKSGCWFQIFFHVHPENWGRYIHFDSSNIFQRGWFNHQLL